MKNARQKITYANVVATLALFIALGGVSWAAVKLPKNSVGSAQIKKNAVAASEIKKNAVAGSEIKTNAITSSDVKNNALTGSDINAGTLGKVPSAGNADRAASAGSVDTLAAVSKRVAPSFSGGSSQDDARQNASEVPLGSNGQVSIYGKCYVYSSTLYVEVLQKSSADGALSYGGSYSYYGGSGYLNTSTPESQRYLMNSSAGNNSYGYSYSSNPITLYGADGNGLMSDFQIWAKRGNLPTYGNGAYGPGDVCIFQYEGTKLNAG